MDKEQLPAAEHRPGQIITGLKMMKEIGAAPKFQNTVDLTQNHGRLFRRKAPKYWKVF